MLKRIHGHTVDTNLLYYNIVIDLGCRDFLFSKEMVDLGCCVCAYDADKTVLEKLPPGVEFKNYAVGVKSGMTKIYYELTEGAFTSDVKEFNGNYYEIETISYKDIVNQDYDILKIDIEGGEYAILSDPTFIPYPKQITVEFHEHSLLEIHNNFFTKV